MLRTNGFQAYAAARYRQQKAGADIFPYWKYVTMDDGRVRDRHAELDGVILPADDPFWKDHYPPWDFNCRCIVIEMDEETAREEAAAGEGSMWDQGMRDKWAADHAAWTRRGSSTSGRTRWRWTCATWRRPRGARRRP